MFLSLDRVTKMIGSMYSLHSRVYNRMNWSNKVDERTK